ncbi:unnamed protein product [Prunus armeniaca]|uniref:Uncharacterized protein n=1 Tax=Prunus armeniaca TaxID=36596 RepID=A0A6J5X222_PRUAR|nr:unnamed protein product [Prunus armeniaca]
MQYLLLVVHGTLLIEKKLYESGSSARLTIVNVVGNLLVLLLKVETWSGRLKMQCMNEISNVYRLISVLVSNGFKLT